MKIYVASSWRNTRQPEVVEALRARGHEVYDFRHPAPGNEGFSWKAIDGGWQSWSSEQAAACELARSLLNRRPEALQAIAEESE